MKRMTSFLLALLMLLPLLASCGLKVKGKSYTYLPDSGAVSLEGVEFTEEQQASFRRTLDKNFKDSVLVFTEENAFEYTYSVFSLPPVTSRQEGKRSGNTIVTEDGRYKVEILEDRVILTVPDLIYQEGSVNTVVFTAKE